MPRTKKNKVPTTEELLTLANKSIKEMEKSINYLAKVRDGELIEEKVGEVKKAVEFDNKDKIQAALRSVDIGKFFFDLAYKNAASKEALKKDEGVGTKEEPKQTAPVFSLKSFNGDK